MAGMDSDPLRLGRSFDCRFTVAGAQGNPDESMLVSTLCLLLRAGYGETDWARTTRETYGVAKLVVDRNGTILGAGIAGSGASELVALFSLAIAQRLKVTDLAGFATASASLAQIANQLGATAQRLKGPPRWLASWQKLVRLIG